MLLESTTSEWNYESIIIPAEIVMDASLHDTLSASIELTAAQSSPTPIIRACSTGLSSEEATASSRLYVATTLHVHTTWSAHACKLLVGRWWGAPHRHTCMWLDQPRPQQGQHMPAIKPTNCGPQITSPSLHLS